MIPSYYSFASMREFFSWFKCTDAKSGFYYRSSQKQRRKNQRRKNQRRKNQRRTGKRR